MDAPEDVRPIVDEETSDTNAPQGALEGPSQEDLAALEKSRLERLGGEVKQGAMKRMIKVLAPVLMIPLSMSDDATSIIRSLAPDSDIARAVEKAGMNENAGFGSYRMSKADTVREQADEIAQAKLGLPESGSAPPYNTSIAEVDRIFQQLKVRT